MPKGSDELIARRRDEIINACESLYERMSFKDVTIRKIGEVTSFTRTSIYNYFRSKEEIFLALLGREYEALSLSIKDIRENNGSLSACEFASLLSHTIEKRVRLLKLVSMNHYEIEENSSLEALVEFKKLYAQAIDEVRACLQKFFPSMTDDDIESFIYSFFPFLFGIYPYTAVTDKQKKAMELACFDYPALSVYEITYHEVVRLLGGK